MTELATIDRRPCAPGAAGPAPLAVPWDLVERFLSQFTHDVRNGLNALELQLTLLGEISENPEVQEEVLGLRTTIASIGRDLQRLREDTAPVRPERVPYPATDLLEDLRSRLRRLHPVAAETLRWEVGPEVAGETLEADPELVFAAAGRLFDNTVRFRSSPTSPVGFQATCGPGAEGNQVLRFTFREEDKTPPALGDLSTWGDRPLLTSGRGAKAYGLGLFRARRIVEAHDGDLVARYDGSARQLEVSLEWPLPVTDHGRESANIPVSR